MKIKNFLLFLFFSTFLFLFGFLVFEVEAQLGCRYCSSGVCATAPPNRPCLPEENTCSRNRDCLRTNPTPTPTPDRTSPPATSCVSYDFSIYSNPCATLPNDTCNSGTYEYNGRTYGSHGRVYYFGNDGRDPTNCYSCSGGGCSNIYTHQFYCPSSCNYSAPPTGPGNNPYSPPPSNNNNRTIGYFDYVDPNTCTLYGWTCDPDSYSTPLMVQVHNNYAYAISINGQVNFLANVNRPDLVTNGNVCGGTTNHGFAIQLPQEYRDGVQRRYAVYAFGTGNEGSVELTNSPRLATCYPPVSCQITSLSLSKDPLYGAGDSATATANVNVVPSNASVSVNFGVSSSSIISISPTSDNTSPYQTNVTANRLGTSLLTATATATLGSYSVNCTASNNSNVRMITVTNPSAWWQVTNADVISGGSIRSNLPPSTSYFNLRGSADTPGLVIYNNSLNLGNGQVSERGWAVQTNATSLLSTYNYDYFYRNLPSEVKYEWDPNSPLTNRSGYSNLTTTTINSLGNFGTFNVNGYTWFLATQNLTINSSLSIPSNRRLVVFVNGNLNINADIDLSNNSFIMFIVSGNISVSPNVTSLQGIYVANNDSRTFSTGTNGPDSDNMLTVRGTVVARNVSLQRSLTNNSYPAEQFVFNPSLMLQIPYSFYERNFKWREVAP
jgi:hypothetical protein